MLALGVFCASAAPSRKFSSKPKRSLAGRVETMLDSLDALLEKFGDSGQCTPEAFSGQPFPEAAAQCCMCSTNGKKVCNFPTPEAAAAYVAAAKKSGQPSGTEAAPTEAAVPSGEEVTMAASCK